MPEKETLEPRIARIIKSICTDLCKSILKIRVIRGMVWARESHGCHRSSPPRFNTFTGKSSHRYRWKAHGLLGRRARTRGQ